MDATGPESSAHPALDLALRGLGSLCSTKLLLTLGSKSGAGQAVVQDPVRSMSGRGILSARAVALNLGTTAQKQSVTHPRPATLLRDLRPKQLHLLFREPELINFAHRLSYLLNSGCVNYQSSETSFDSQNLIQTFVEKQELRSEYVLLTLAPETFEMFPQL